jgi:DEAD/DEAH box helicase domain-containing protein
MTTPNYAALLQSFWTPPTSPILEYPDSKPTDILEFLADDLLWQQTIPAQNPDLKDIPTDLPSELIQALQAQGIKHLYAHQLKTLKAIRLGKSLILTSPTASGKTLSTYPGILEGCINEGHRAFAFYGLRALALDQFHKLSQLLATIPTPSRPIMAMITGDVHSEERERILAQFPHILGVTPELIHFQLKQVWKSEQWAAFYERLRYVLIDEAHTFGGSYGANMAWLIRRLKLAVDRYGGNSKKLQFIFLSATCGNPKQLAQKLSGLKPTQNHPKPIIWIHKSGAATPIKRVIVTQPSHNLTADTARIVQFLLEQGKSGIAFCNSRPSVRQVTELLKSSQVAAFYSGITSERRAELIEQLQKGTIKWLIATEALEAGIDLPELECCVLRGWPGSKMAYQQRSGRAGRSQAGLTVLIPAAYSPIDRYIAEHPESLVSPEAEKVSFNDEYPMFVAKHLMCAAAETGIPTNKIKHYFGDTAVAMVKLLLNQGHLNKGRLVLWAKGYPHKDVNFRGGLSQNTIKLIDADSGEELEEVSEDIAHREVHPQAIYKRQDTDGQIITYHCLSLDLKTKRAMLKQTADSSLFTVAITESQTSPDNLLIDPCQLSLLCDREHQTIEGSMTVELNFGQVNHITSGYSLMTQLYEQTCLNKHCLKYKEPLPQQHRCPLCSKLTRKAVIVQVLGEERFEQPYQTQFSAPMVKVTIDQVTQDYLRQWTQEIKRSLTQSLQTIPSGYQQLWEYPSNFIALHSFGHQIMRALPLIARVDPKEINFAIVRELGESNSSYTGYFYDTSDGGTGATEAVFQHLRRLAEKAFELTQGCPKCLVQPGCPDSNKGLVKQLGLVLLDALAWA